MTTIRLIAFIHDHRLQGREAKQTNEQRKPELSSTETNQASEEPEPAACGESGPKGPGPRRRGDGVGRGTYHSDTLVGGGPGSPRCPPQRSTCEIGRAHV